MYRIRLYIVPERPDEEVDVGSDGGGTSGTSIGDDEDEDLGFWSSGDSERGRPTPPGSTATTPSRPSPRTSAVKDAVGAAHRAHRRDEVRCRLVSKVHCEDCSVLSA